MMSKKEYHTLYVKLLILFQLSSEALSKISVLPRKTLKKRLRPSWDYGLNTWFHCKYCYAICKLGVLTTSWILMADTFCKFFMRIPKIYFFFKIAWLDEQPGWADLGRQLGGSNLEKNYTGCAENDHTTIVLCLYDLSLCTLYFWNPHEKLCKICIGQLNRAKFFKSGHP